MHARFMSNGSAREIFDWDCMCDVELPVTSIDEQRRIVHDYQVITDRIDLLRKINANLDSIAYTQFKKLFNSKEQSGWHLGSMSEMVSVNYGKDHSALKDGNYPLYGSGGIMRFVERPLYDKVSVLVPRKGSLNNILYVDEPFWSVDTMFYTEIFNPKASKFVYYFLRDIDFISLNSGSAVPSTSADVILGLQLNIPDENSLKEFDDTINPLFIQIMNNRHEYEKLQELKMLMLSSSTKGV